MRTLKILWMYHDLMDLYGDKGNLMVLKTRCEKRGIACTIDTCTIGEVRDLTNYDLFFLGGGADREQGLIYEDLLQRKEDIQKAYDSKTVFLLICGGYQLFGRYYKDQDGKEIPGLGLFDYYTESSDRDHRCIGNIAVKITMDEETFEAVGFENHGGQTQNVQTPLGVVLKGHGNTYKCTHEGFVNDQVLATYMHGPLLPKNPKIADLLLQRALRRRGQDTTLSVLDDTWEDEARKIMLKRMQIVDAKDTIK